MHAIKNLNFFSGLSCKTNQVATFKLECHFGSIYSTKALLSETSFKYFCYHREHFWSCLLLSNTWRGFVLFPHPLELHSRVFSCLIWVDKIENANGNSEKVIQGIYRPLFVFFKGISSVEWNTYICSFKLCRYCQRYFIYQ